MGKHILMGRTWENRGYFLCCVSPHVHCIFRSETASPVWELPNCSGKNLSEHGHLQRIPVCRMGINIPSGGKLNPRFVCSWRSYARHWMRNAWFLANNSVHDIRRATVFWFFPAFCIVFCIHELPKSASFFCSFLEICRF